MPLSAGDKFCSSCGQKTETHRLTLHDLLHDTIHFFTHADKGIFHLFKELAIRPGTVARSYVSGARKKYFNPINFLLIVAGIVVFMTAILTKSGDMGGRRQESNQSTVTKPPTMEERKMYERGAKVGKFFAKYSNFVPILATPLFAFFFWLFYKKGQFNYTEHLIANMYFVGFILLFYALFFLPLRSFYGEIATIVFFLFESTYRGTAYYQFMGRKGAWPLTKAFLISFFLAGVWIAGTGFIIRIYIETGFKDFF